MSDQVQSVIEQIRKTVFFRTDLTPLQRLQVAEDRAMGASLMMKAWGDEWLEMSDFIEGCRDMQMAVTVGLVEEV